MSSEKQFLRPGQDPATGEPFAVYLPSKGRNISPEGESLVVDSHLARRILSGELVQAEPAKAKATRSTTAAPTTQTPGA